MSSRSMEEDEESEHRAFHVPKVLEPYRLKPNQLLIFRQESAASSASVLLTGAGVNTSIRVRRVEFYQPDVHNKELPPERVGNADWCLCETCQPMSQDVNCFCCWESKPACNKMNAGQCITLHKDFLWSLPQSCNDRSIFGRKS